MVRPLLSGRDYHALHHENPGFDFSAEVTSARVLWRPYPGVPAISPSTMAATARTGVVPHLPVRRRRDRGLDFIEDLASPGVSPDAERQRGHADAERGRGLARSGRGLAPGRGSERRRRRFHTRSIARPTPTWCAAAPARPSSPAIRGSPTGAATLSSRCAASGSRAGSSSRATSCSPGRGRCPRDAAEPLSGLRRATRIQCGRRLALVRHRGARAAAGAPRRRLRVSGRR